MAEADAAILGRLMLAFEGRTVPTWVARRLATAPAAGLTLFRAPNVESPAQVRELTNGLQAAARRFDPTAPPLLIAIDQEGGQLDALGAGSTEFAGNMALGAAGDPALAERVGAAIGRELAAVGINLDYAPDLDLATNPGNPGLGIRSFGDDPEAAGRLAAAFIRGLRSEGVAATAKHFPGKGDVGLDTHFGLATVESDRARLEAVELAPFRAAIAAGADLVMSGHFAVPALSGDPALPSTLSRVVMDRLLRRELGFRGVTITDALDMRALAQGSLQIVEVIAAIRAEVDLLLATPDRAAQRRIEAGLVRAVSRGLFDPPALARSARRVARLRRRLRRTRKPDLGALRSAAHLALASELAERSVTLLRDDAGLLPIDPAGVGRVLAVMPAPRDLTPADTSSYVEPGLATALRAVVADVEEVVTGHPPSAAEIAGVRDRAQTADLVVVGTINASFDPAQVALVEAVLATGRPVVSVALRAPFDLADYPATATHLATYSIHPEPLAVLADVLVGRRQPVGRLPVAIPSLLPRGHGLGIGRP
jgi:beta-N-acetylhexosaminidase